MQSHSCIDSTFCRSGFSPDVIGEKLFIAKSADQRLFRGDVCRLGPCPDFRVAITRSEEVDVAEQVINALAALDSKCRCTKSGSELTKAFQSSKELPFGWELQAFTYRDTTIWMDPEEKIEINVSRAFELTVVSKPDEQSEDDNFEIRFSSHELTDAVQRNDDAAWNHMEALLSTVQMLHDSLRHEMGTSDLRP